MIDNLVITGDVGSNGAYISDWFRFQLISDSTNPKSRNYDDAFVEIDLDDTYDGLSDADNLGDLDLYLYKVVQTDDTQSFEDAYEDGAYRLVLIGSSKGVGDTERIDFSKIEDIEDGNYFICVSGFNGSANRYSMTLGGFTEPGEIAPTDPSEYFNEDNVTVLNSVATVNWRVPVTDYVSRVGVEYCKVGDDGSDGEWIEVGSFKRSVTSCKIAGLEPDTTYRFRLTVYNHFAEDGLSATVEKTTDAYLNETVYRAVIVGVADYPGSANDLIAPVNDAKAFREALLEDPQWAEENIILLTNAEATRGSVFQALQEIAAVSDDNDVFVFYFAGGGTSAIIGGRQLSYLKTCGSARSEFISNVDLLNQINAIAAGSKQFILDAGQVPNGVEETSVLYKPFVSSLTTSTANGRSTVEPQIVVLTPGDDTGTNLSQVGSGSRSVFNRALVNAMAEYSVVVTEEEVAASEDETLVESDGRVSFDEILKSIAADDNIINSETIVSLAANSTDEAILMSGEWSEQEAFNSEWLEQGAIVVTTPVDCVDDHDGKISLREAAALVGTILDRETTLAQGDTFTVKAGSIIAVGVTSGTLVEDVQVTYERGGFRTAGACSIQTATAQVDFTRVGAGVTWSADDWADGNVTILDKSEVELADVEFQLVATTVPETEEEEATSVVLKDGDTLTTAIKGGKEVVVTKVGQYCRLYMDGAIYTRTSGLFLNGVPVTISNAVEISQEVTLNKIVFDASLEGQSVVINAKGGPIVFANGGVVDASSLVGKLTIDGNGESALIQASGTNLVSLVGLKYTNAKGSAFVVDEGASLEIANSLIYDVASGKDSVIANAGELYLVNDTIINNSSDSTLIGGAGTVELVNTIVALNSADISNIVADSTNYVSDADPGFTDPANGDYTLLKTATDVIDVGRNSAVKTKGGVVLEYDLAGNERVSTAGTIDAGAYEYTVADEDRETPSTIVTILDDVVDATDGEISLREAFAYAGTTYQVETELEEGAVVTTQEGDTYEYKNGKLVSFDGVSGLQSGQYYTVAGVYLVDSYGEATLLDEGDVVTLANGAKATVVGTRLLRASGVPVQSGQSITTEDGVTGTLEYGIVTDFVRNQQISVALTAAAIDPTTPVGTFDAGTYTLTYLANGNFSATLKVTTTNDNNQSTTETFEATFRLVQGTAFSFLDAEGATTGEGLIATTRTVELEDGKYSLLAEITDSETGTVYAPGAVLTLTRGVFTDVDGNVVNVVKGTKLTSPTGATVEYQNSFFSVANLEEGTELIGEDGVVRRFKDGSTLVEDVTLGTTILFKKGLENGTITLERGDISVERAVTLDATLNGGLTIDAHAASRIFTIDMYRETSPTAVANFNGLTLVNGADAQGGTIYVAEGSNFRLANSSITGTGSVGEYGGAIYNAGKTTIEATTKDMSIENVAAERGGAIYNTGTITVNGATISAPIATFGAGLYNAGTATLAGAVITGGVAATYGGAVYNAGTLAVTKSSDLTGNQAVNGGGVYNAGSVNVVNSSINGNVATASGAALYNAGKASLSSAKIIGNSAETYGGAIYDAAQFFATRTVIADNTAKYQGSAIYGAGDATLVSSLMISNGGESASANKYVVYVDGGKVALTGDTVVGNKQAGAYVGSGSFVLYNTILGDNVVRDIVVAGGSVDAQYSMVENSEVGLPATNLSYEPNFANFNKSEDWNDWNLRLGGGSPAVGGGSVDYNYYLNFNGKKTPVTVDFGGSARVTESGVDVGAYSSTTVQETASTVVTTWEDVVDPTDGLISLREAIRYASNGKTVAERTVTFSPDLFALTDSGTVYLDSDLQTIIIGTQVTVTSEYVDEFGQTQYHDITIDGTNANAPLFMINGDADVEMRGFTFANGYATGENESGGAFIIHDGTLALLDSTIRDNKADRHGGAVYQDGGVFYAIDSLFTGNEADQTYGFGGAICMTDGQAYIYNTTIADNGTGVYGGVFAIDGLFVLANSIVAQNGGAQNVDVYANNLEATANLIGAMDPWRSVDGFNGNVAGTVTSPVDPLFTDVENGDFTLASGSLAINAGVNSYAFGPDGVRLKRDLNADERIRGGVVDMGAFESQFEDVPSTVVTTLADTVDQTDGLVSLREAIAYSKQFGSPITFDLGDDFEGGAEIRLDATSGALTVDSNVVIDASKVKGGLTIYGSDDRIFYLNGGTLTLSGVALTGGYGTRGGAIYGESGSINLTNVLIYGNEAEEEGGAIYLASGDATLLNTTIASNSAPNVPGAYFGGAVTLHNTIVAANASENSASDENFDLYVGGKLSPVASIVGIASDSDAALYGGYNGNVFGTDEAVVDAGFNSAASYDFTLAQDSIAVNAGSNRLIGMPGYYASILLTASNQEIIRTDFDGAPRLVGGVVDIGAYEFQTKSETASVVVTTLEDVVDPFDNKISIREAIEYAGSVTYADGVTNRVGRTITFDPTLANGVIQLVDTLEITKCVTIDATALQGTMTLDGGGEFGVVVLNGKADSVADSVNLYGLHITGGVADYGAGVYHADGAATLVNCVIYGNEGMYGAGVASLAEAKLGVAGSNALTLINCTIAANDAEGGFGGLWSRGSDVNLYNTLIAKNTTNGEVGADMAVSSLGGMVSTLVGVSNDSFARKYNGVSGNVIGTSSAPVDPYFTNLAANDFTLSSSESGVISVAMNAGDSSLTKLADGSVPATDAANHLRIIGGLVDIGAFESELGPTEIPSLLVTTLEDVVDAHDGLISLREAVAYADNYGLATTITFADRLSGGTLYLKEALPLSKSVTIDALTSTVNGITLTTADDVLDQSILYVNGADVVINGLKISNRYGERLREGSTLNVDKGGAIFVNKGSISIYNSLIYDNAAKTGSAIYVNEESDSATVTLVNCTVVDNVGQTTDVNESAAIYSVAGVVNLWNTITARTTTSDGATAQDVYKGAVNRTKDTVVNRLSSTYATTQYGTTALELQDGDTVTYYYQTLTYSGGALYYNYGTDYQTEVTLTDGAVIGVAATKTLAFNSDGWYLDGVAYELNLNNGDTAQWTDSATGTTTTVYYNNGTFRKGSRYGAAVSFVNGDSLEVNVNVSYAYNATAAAFYRVNVTTTQSGWFRREYNLTQEAAAEFAQQVYQELKTELDRQTQYTKTVNGVELSYPIIDKSLSITSYSAEVSRNMGDEGGYSVDFSVVARYEYVTQMGVSVLHSYISLSDSLASMASGNGSFIGSAENDLSGETENLFTDVENGDYTLRDDALATNGGNNAYFNQGTFNGTFDSWDITGNQRIYYATVDMGAYENLVAKDSPVTSVSGSTVRITVTSPLDVVDSSDGVTTFREALQTADKLYERGYTDINIVFSSSYDVSVDASQGALSVNSPVTITANGATINAQSSGNGLLVATPGAVMISNLIVKNGLSVSGAGIKLTSGDLTLSNCLIYNCEASSDGGAIYTSSTGNLRLYNTTVAKNVAVNGCGIYGTAESNVQIYNSIVATNKSSKVGAVPVDVELNGARSVYYSLLGNLGTAANAAKYDVNQNVVGYGVDNDVDPAFVNPSGNNFRISATLSPAKNAGSTAYILRGSYDLEGNYLSAGTSVVSMGAYQIGTEVPSTVVTTLDDVVDSTDGLISLREAILYTYDSISGAGTGSLDNGAYNATNAMNTSGVYGATYYSPITFHPSLAGGTITLNSGLTFNQTTYTNTVFDYLIDASSIAGLGGITIDCTNIQSEGGWDIPGLGNSTAFQISGRADTDNGLYWPVHLDIRNVKIVGDGGTGFATNSYGIVTTRNCLIEGFDRAISVGDNDNDQAGIAHVYNTTIVGGIYVGGSAYLYNSIVTGGVTIRDTDNDPGYRQVRGYSSYVGYTGGLGRYTGDAGSVYGGNTAALFIDYYGGDYRLADRSILVNMGNNDYVQTLAPTHADAEVDANGNLRILNDTVDIGCYERQFIGDKPSATVTTTEDVDDPNDGLISIREAIAYTEQATSLVGNTVYFSADLDGETIKLNAPISVTRDLSFSGAGSNITLDAQGNGSVFDINVTSVQANVPDVYIRNLKLTGGSATNGGAINVTSGNVYMSNLWIYGNEAARYGGAIYANNSELTIVDCRIGGNHASYYGGVVNEFGKTVLTNSYVAENTATIANAGADIWGRAAVNYVNSKNNVVGYVADNITLYDGVNNNRIGTAENPIKPFVSASTGNLEVLTEYALDASASKIDTFFENFVDEESSDLAVELDAELSVFDDELFEEF